MAPILVVGAGPVGLTMAAELARYGVAVRIIDKSNHPTQTSKALVVWSRTLELMDRMGCTPAFLATGVKCHGTTLRHGTTVLGHPTFETINSAYNFALMIPQSETERLLAAHLQSFGIAVERDVELIGFEATQENVAARLRHADGHEEHIETPWLLGCDGAHSVVRHGLGLEFVGETEGGDWVLADVKLDGDHAPPIDEIAVYFHRAGPLVVFPIPGGRTRIVAEIGKSDPDRPRADPTLDEVQELVTQRASDGIRVSAPVWLSNFHINERKVEHYGASRVLIAGDAAHIHSPAGGQGMNTGMQDAVGLAWRLALVTQGASARLIDSYSPERSAVGEMVLRNATRLTDLGTLESPTAQAARDIAVRFFLGFHYVRERMAAQMSETEIAYSKSPLSQGHHAGDRFPPEHYEGTPPGAGNDPRFVLYAEDADAGTKLAAQFPGLLQPTPRKSYDPSRLMIVRPDAYIGFIDRANAWEAAEAYLTALAA